MKRLVSYALRQGWRRGVLGGSRTWVALGGAALLVRLVSRAAGRSPEVVFSERLEPGESIRITHEPPA